MVLMKLPTERIKIENFQNVIPGPETYLFSETESIFDVAVY